MNTLALNAQSPQPTATQESSNVAASDTQSSSDSSPVDTFLTLFVAEIQNQDPTDPTDATEYIDQLSSMAQVAMMEEMSVQANTNAVLIVAPIAISLAQTIGADVLPFVLATAVGAGLSVATILSNASVTITASAGYRFKDFMAYGGIVNGVATVMGVIALRIFFF